MLYDHVDLRVRDLAASKVFYDAVMPALGLTAISADDEGASYYPQGDRHKQPFFGIMPAGDHVPDQSRIALAAASRSDVDRIAAIARGAGALSIEGPELCTEYGPNYYAVFFEDPDGNKLEICNRG